MNPIFSYSIIFFVIAIIGRASIFSSDVTSFVLISILGLYSGYRRIAIDPKIVYFFLIFIAINLAASLFIGNEFRFISIGKFSLVLLILPYLLISVFKRDFWVIFEKIIFTLTLISLPLFILNILMPELFNQLTPFFKPLTQDVFYKFNPNSDYWSSIIYTNAISFDSNIFGKLYRNCGFMWEPGGFALMIIWALIFNRIKSGRVVSFKVLIYSLALVTTFSTSGIPALGFILISYFVGRSWFLNTVVLLLFIFIFGTYVYTLDFVGGEITDYINTAESGQVVYNSDYGFFKVNRFQIFLFDLIKVSRYPFGDGYGGYEEIVGVNGLSRLLVTWGVPVFFWMLFQIFRYIRNLFKNDIGLFGIITLFTGLLIMIFSNPVDRSIFIFLLIFSPWLILNQKTSTRQL